MLSFLLVFSVCFFTQAQIKLPAIFGDHMVLQQKQDNPVWGWASPGEMIKVSINGQSHSTKANQKGEWRIMLRPVQVGGPYKLRIEGDDSRFYFDDVLVGEVWICSGQSNMEWPISRTNSSELATLTSNYKNIRLITVPRVGTQEPQDDFNGEWSISSPESIEDFSAIGYFFGRSLHHALDVPIGLIDNSWGGSAAEAWVNKDKMLEDGNFTELMSWWQEQEEDYDFDALLAEWKQEAAEWDATDEDSRVEDRPRRPRNLMTGNHRPGNIYNGVLYPTIGYGIKGVIWYQGESNAGRAYEYRHLFPMMIQHWRDEWEQGDFPFYYVQLADFQAELTEPEESTWAELREAQTMTMDKLKNVGQAVAIDVGEGRDIHPRNKQTVADRLARWALAKDYNKDIIFSGPTYKSMKIEGNKITISFDNVGSGLYSFDTRDPQGFIITGEDQKFVNADAKIISKNEIEIWSEAIINPVAIRYAWAQNPICNMYNREGLPMTPFRTDEWPGITSKDK